MPAIISIHYHCGCGFKAENLAEAVLHSDKMLHTVDVSGRISKDQKKPRPVRIYNKEE